jgi:hypothetical protein
MEHDPLKPKLHVPEIRNEIELGEKDAKEIQEYIDLHLKDLTRTIEQLEFDMGYYDHMVSANEFAREYREELGKEPRTKEYSEDQIQKIQQGIDMSKAFIVALHEEMNKAILLKIEINAYTEAFEKLEREFNSILIRIPPEQEN